MWNRFLRPFFTFWDGRLQRIAALWRILLQTLLMLLMLALLSTCGIFLYLWSTQVAGGKSIMERLATLDLGAGGLENSPTFLVFGSVIQLIGISLSIWLAGRLWDKRKFVDFGLRFNRQWWLDFGFGLGLGAALMLLIFVIEYAAGWIEITGTIDSGFDGISFGTAIFGALVLFISVGIYEELMSRGYHMKNLSEGLDFLGARTSIVLALILSSAVFGLLHAGNPNSTFISTFNIFLAGIFLGFGYILTGELAIPIGLHITWNFFQGNVFGFPVSGNTIGPSFIQIEQSGNALITGGAFGPEAGLIGIAAIVLGMFLIALWVRQRYGSAALWLAVTEPELTNRHKLVVHAARAKENVV